MTRYADHEQSGSSITMGIASATAPSTMARPHHHHDSPDDPQHSSGDSSDFFSPISMSFFAKQKLDTMERNKQQQQQRHAAADCWIGARLSPIGSFDNEPHHDDDDDPDHWHHLALHETLDAAPFVVATATSAHERTSLLMGRHYQQQQQQQQLTSYGHDDNFQHDYNHARHHGGPIHPMWDGSNENTKGRRKQHGRRRPALVVCGLRIHWGLIVCLVVALQLLAMTIRDVVNLHASVWNGSTWSNSNFTTNMFHDIPYLHPSESTLISFGAFVPERILQQPHQYWRILSSACMCTSYWELLWMMVSWRLVFLAATSSRWYRWSGLYICAIVTGQLWTLAWDNNDSGLVCGCAAWGTVAVVCSVGIRCPSRRFGLFVLAAVGIYMAYWQGLSFGSIYGMVGSAICGWGLASSEAGAAASQKSPRLGVLVNLEESSSMASTFRVLASRGLTVACIVAPVLVIAIR